MKQKFSPPRNGRPRPLRLRFAVLLGWFAVLLLTGELSAQSPVTALAPGNLLHVRLTSYEFSTYKDLNDVRRTQVRPGLELVYEKVGEAGRGTRYLIGWEADVYNNSVQELPFEPSYYNTSRHTFRLGVGKSQAAQYKRLVLRGGVDTYLAFSPGSRTKAFQQDSTGTQEDAISGPPSFRLAARPFVGVGFQISARMAIGIEYGADLGIDASFGSTRYTYSGPFNSEYEVKQTRLGLFVESPSFLPFINLNYRF
jgi:hypothetical protein